MFISKKLNHLGLWVFKNSKIDLRDPHRKKIGQSAPTCTVWHLTVIFFYLPTAYEEGAALGADYIECDVQITKDLQLICSHEAWIKDVCNVETFPEFADRLTTYNMDDDDPDFDWNDKGQGGSLHQIGLKRNCTM